MIFVTVGTHYQGFERLVRKMDEIAAEIDEEVVMQTGYTEYQPQNAKWFRFKDYDEILDIYKSANIIVSHAGAGTLLDSLSFEKQIIVVPRLKKFNEHIDDQQLELAEALENSGRAAAVYDIEKLEEVINNTVLNTFNEPNIKLSNFLEDYLKGIER